MSAGASITRVLRQVLLLGGFVAAYFSAGKLGLSLAFVNASASAVWPATGMALAAVVLFGYWMWPAVFAGAFLVNLSTTGQIATSLAISFGNTLEAVTGAWLLQHWAGGLNALFRPSGVFKFVLLVAMASTALSATCGTTSLFLGKLLRAEEYGLVWLTWWIGDLVSNVTIAPLLLVWGGTRFSSELRARALEGGFLFASLLAACWLVFGGWLPSGAVHYPLEYLTIPVLLWAVFRFGQHGGTASICIIALIAITGTLRGFGPFALYGANEALLLLQAFLSTVAIMALALGAIITERGSVQRRLDLEHTVMRSLAEAPDLRAASPQLLRAIGENTGAQTAVLWNADTSGQRHRCVGTWSSASEPGCDLERTLQNEELVLAESAAKVSSENWILAKSKKPLTRAAEESGVGPVTLAPIQFADKSLGLLGLFGQTMFGATTSPIEPLTLYAQKQHLPTAMGMAGRRRSGKILGPIRGTQDAQTLLDAIAIDLAQFMERKRAEDALRESELRYAQMLDSVQDMVLCKAPGSIITYANKATCEHFGMPPQQLLGRVELPFTTPEMMWKCLDDDRRVFESGLSVEVAEEPNTGRDGHRRIFHTIKSPIFDVHGKVVEIVAVSRDVTERRQAEEILRKSRERFRSLVMATAQVVWTTTAEGDVVEDLPTWRAFTGQTKEQMLGRGWMERVHPDDRERTRLIWEHSLATKTPHENEFRVRVADGTYRHVLARAVPVFASDGSIREWVGTCTDITEKKQAEEALRASEERYRALAETSPAGIWQTTVDGYTLFINPAMCRLLELDSRDEIEGKTYRDFYTPESVERVKLEHAKRLRGLASNYEVEVIGKRGTHRFLLICGAPLYARDGSIQSFIATLTDITPQKHALDALRASERRFQTLAENAPDVIARFDRAHRYLYVSPAVEQAFGQPPKWFLGRTNGEAGLPANVASEWELRIEQTFRDATKRSLEFCILGHDGIPKHYDTRLVPEFGKQDSVQTVLAVTRDVTGLKRAEAEIKRLNQDLERRVRERTSALQETNDQLEAFCYSISHDLRAPLRAMRGFTDALLEDYGARLDDTGRNYAQRIGSAARRMDQLIQDLLEYSRLGRMSLVLKPLRLDPIIDNVLAHLAEEIRRRQAEVVVHRPLPELTANEMILEQVVLNLVSNALKFVRPNVAPRVEIFAEENSHWVRISIQDNGIGIAEAHQERIFRVFERLHGMEEFPGTGIGLAIVRKGVERLGGRVGVESKLDAGSRFWVELPKRER